MPINLFVIEVGRKPIFGVFCADFAVVKDSYYLWKKKAAEGLNAVNDIGDR